MSNIVLLHGAYQGGWIWQPLASVLRNRGHYVLAPTLEGCAERSYQLHSKITTESHAQEIANLLFLKSKPIVFIFSFTLTFDKQRSLSQYLLRTFMNDILYQKVYMRILFEEYIFKILTLILHSWPQLSFEGLHLKSQTT